MTNFTILDGSIVGLYLLATMAAGIMVRRYVSKVEDFLVAGREMDVYLGIASLAATEFGIVTCMYTAQNGFEKGFAGAIPGILTFLAMFLVGYTGFCIKPLRDSGVMTIPQLFEKQFGPRVRWAAGVVIVLGGLLNMGVFLRTGGEFLVNVSGLDPGNLERSTVETHYGEGGFNPLKNPSMGWSYVIFNVLLNTATVLTWQTQIARVLAAKDSTTGRKVYTGTSFFFVARFLIPGIWGIAALALLTPEQVGGNSLQAMPKMLAMVVPAGFMGLLVAAMLAADMSTDSSYMLSWGSVIYNDIMAPFRKTAWPEAKGLFWNRSIIAIIGVFLLFYGLWYKIEGDLWTYLGLTGTIYLSSMSILLIACCYWKRANSWGAFAAIVFGAVVPVGTLVLQKIGPYTEWFNQNDALCGAATYVVVALAMVIGSLLKPRGGLG